MFSELSRPQKIRFTKLSPLARKEARIGLLFLLPWIIGFLAFTLIPLVASLVFSLLNLTLTQPEPLKFIGLENYQTLLSDSQIWSSLLVTVKFAALALPIGLAIPILLALLINSKYLKGRAIFRTLFYAPAIVPFVAAIYAWNGMLNPDTGWVNRLLQALGVQEPPTWVNDPNTVYLALVIIGLWGVGNSMVLYLAGLQGVPSELYDAAQVDGAGWWATLRNVTLPMISPVIMYDMTLATIGLFQYFLVPLVINSGTGAPGNATMFFNLYLYKTFFAYGNMGYGASLAWLLFAVILVATVILFKSQKYWVYYAGESR
ncbi:Lactose transport system permease protein LacF [Thermoflexales bacterium]|jgi:multiple sugar transport system permease protein|nr:Lactose transport system permease protein LacF [Thermoflexales bacterium]